MLINIIVSSSLLLACGFLFIWFFNTDLREKIERPKYDFQNQVKAFDEQTYDTCTKGINKNEAEHEG